jgi:hypothetical protein
MQRLTGRKGVELLFRVVQVVEVYRPDPEVLSAAIDLMLEEAGRQAVAIRNQLAHRDDTRRQELPPDVFLVFSPRGWRRTIEREIAALGADDHLVPRDLASGHGLPEGSPDGPLRPLASIIDGRVDDVHTVSERLTQGLHVAGIVDLVAFAEVGADPDGRREERVPEGPVEIGRDPR